MCYHKVQNFVLKTINVSRIYVFALRFISVDNPVRCSNSLGFMSNVFSEWRIYFLSTCFTYRVKNKNISTICLQFVTVSVNTIRAKNIDHKTDSIILFLLNGILFLNKTLIGIYFLYYRYKKNRTRAFDLFNTRNTCLCIVV